MRNYDIAWFLITRFSTLLFTAGSIQKQIALSGKKPPLVELKIHRNHFKYLRDIQQLHMLVAFF